MVAAAMASRHTQPASKWGLVSSLLSRARPAAMRRRSAALTAARDALCQLRDDRRLVRRHEALVEPQNWS